MFRVQGDGGKRPLVCLVVVCEDQEGFLDPEEGVVPPEERRRLGVAHFETLHLHHLRLRVQGVGFRVQSSGCRIAGLGFRFRVEWFELRV